MGIVVLKAHGYTFTQDLSLGFYWNSFPINMTKFAVDDSQGQILNILTNQAVAEWENAIGENIWDVGSSYEIGNGSSGNFIKWSFNFSEETGYDEQSTLAVATRFTQGTHIVRTYIILNGNNLNLFNNVNNMLYATILHEFGHTIGLGHSQMPAIMQASINWYRNLQEDDISGGIHAMDTHLDRKATGFVAPSVAASEENDSLSLSGCGTVNLGPGSNGPGPMGGMFILVLGALASMLRLTRIVI